MFFSFNSKIITMVAIGLIAYMAYKYKQGEPINTAFDGVKNLSEKSASYIMDFTKDPKDFSWYEKALMYVFHDKIKEAKKGVD